MFKIEIFNSNADVSENVVYTAEVEEPFEHLQELDKRVFGCDDPEWRDTNISLRSSIKGLRNNAQGPLIIHITKTIV